MIVAKKMLIVRFLFKFIPTNHQYNLKSSLLRWAGATIDRNVRICSTAKIIGNGKLSIGDNTWIGHDAMLISTANITIGANVDIAPRVYIGTGTHEIDLTTPGIAGKGINKDITIGNGCWLGVGSIILPGVNIGEKCVLAAGAVVTSNFKANNIIGGVPAKVIKRIN